MRFPIIANFCRKQSFPHTNHFARRRRERFMHPRHTITQLENLAAVECPCGTARRAFADRPELPATVHLTEITRDARTHYHRSQTEVYVILRCQSDAAIELDGVLHPVSPLSAILIPPGVRHRGVGEMSVLIYCTPKFDPADEFFDEPADGTG
jgi:hypothetical protein